MCATTASIIFTVVCQNPYSTSKDQRSGSEIKDQLTLGALRSLPPFGASQNALRRAGPMKSLVRCTVEGAERTVVVPEGIRLWYGRDKAGLR